MKSKNIIDPLLLDFPATAAALNISVSFLHTLDNTGKIVPPLKLGTRRLFSVESLRRWIDQSCPTRTELYLQLANESPKSKKT